MGLSSSLVGDLRAGTALPARLRFAATWVLSRYGPACIEEVSRLRFCGSWSAELAACAPPHVPFDWDADDTPAAGGLRRWLVSATWVVEPARCVDNNDDDGDAGANPDADADAADDDLSKASAGESSVIECR